MGSERSVAEAKSARVPQLPRRTRDKQCAAATHQISEAVRVLRRINASCIVHHGSQNRCGAGGDADISSAQCLRMRCSIYAAFWKHEDTQEARGGRDFERPRADMMLRDGCIVVMMPSLEG